MKSFLLLTLAITGAAAGAAAQTPGMRQVYLLPMAGGLDQYLAAELTRAHAMQVVTDPKVADVILTDRIGTAFEAQLAELYPPEPTPAEQKADDRKPGDKGTTVAGSGATTGHRSFRSNAARGTLFLVDTKSRQVVWSDHEKPVAPTDSKLNREAERIVRKLVPAKS